MHDEQSEELAGIAVERSVTLPSDQDSLWEHLTEGDLLGDWMDGDVEIDPRPGGAITLTPDDGPVVWGTVEDVDPGRRIQWTWRTDDGLPTQVEIEVEPVEGGTGLTVRETLLPWRTTGLPPQWIDPPFPGPLLLSTAA